MSDRPKQRVKRQPRRVRDAAREAAEYGIDISMLRDNLRLTPAERMRRHEIALNRVRRLQKARFL